MSDKTQQLQYEIKPFALLTAVALMIVIRKPELIKYPRFWAEEGANYFAYAWKHGFLDAVTVQHFGYYAIVPNISTALATLVPIELAPLVTTIIAALFQLLVSTIIIFGNAPFWDTWVKKFLLAFIVQLLNPFEVWLTTVGTQYWMTIAVFLVLLEQKQNITKLRMYFYRVIVLIAGLSGGQPLFLFPSYLLKAWRTRNIEEYILAGMLFFAGIIQTVVFVSSAKDPYMNTRFGSIDFDLDMFLIWHFIEPYFSINIFSSHIFQALYMYMAKVFPNHNINYMAFTLLLLTIGLTVSIAVSRIRDIYCQIIIMSWVFVTLMSTLLSLQMSSSPRYAFAPSVILLIFHFGYNRPYNLNAIQRFLSLFFIIIVLISSIKEARGPLRIYYDVNLPQWQNEVAQWKIDPKNSILIWPQFSTKIWKVILN